MHKYTYLIENNKSEKKESVKDKLHITKLQEMLAVKKAKKLEKKYSTEEIEKIEKKKNKYFESEDFEKIKDKVVYLWEKLNAHETPLKMKLAIFGGFAYMILPGDVIHDSLPVIGLVDDAAVLLLIWKSCLPYFKEVAKDIVDEQISFIISDKLEITYKGMIIRALCLLLVNIIATLIAGFSPFGADVSKYAASFLFFGCFGYSIYRFVRFFKNNGSIIFKITKEIIKNKSVYMGIAEFIRNADEKSCRKIAKIYQIVDIANMMSDVNIPNLEDAIRHFVKKFFVQVAVFFGTYFLYVITVYWIIKPILLNTFTGMKSWQILIFPVYQLISLFSF